MKYSKVNDVGKVGTNIKYGDFSHVGRIVKYSE